MKCNFGDISAYFRIIISSLLSRKPIGLVYIMEYLKKAKFKSFAKHLIEAKSDSHDKREHCDGSFFQNALGAARDVACN